MSISSTIEAISVKPLGLSPALGVLWWKCLRLDSVLSEVRSALVFCDIIYNLAT